MHRLTKILSLSSALLLVLAVGCSSSDSGGGDGTTDDGGADSTTADSTTDSGARDSAPVDSGAKDSAPVDSGVTDSGAKDSASTDSAKVDSATDAPADTAVADTAVADTTAVDTAVDDTAIDDTAVADTAIDDTAIADDTAVLDTALDDTAIADVVDAPIDVALTCTYVTGATCNSLVNGASDILTTTSTSPTPTGTGGAYSDGVYYITELKGYAGSGFTAGMTFGKQTLMLCGNNAAFVYDRAGSPTERSNFTFAPLGTDPNITETCSFNGGTPIPYSSYTATTTSVTFYSTAAMFSVTYTKP